MHPLKPISSIYIFAGEGPSQKGVDATSVNKLHYLLQQHYPDSSITLVSNQKVQPEQWTASHTLFVLPGGRCSDWTWMQSLGIVEKIKQFVANGGRILGVCAGAYCLAEQSCFQLSENTIKNARGFDFFSGQAIGPLVAETTSIQCSKVEVVKIALEDILQPSALMGRVALVQGGYFLPYKEVRYPYKVLARYTKQPQEKSIAAVGIPIGACRGKIVLTFPHWEYAAEDYPIESLIINDPQHAEKFEKNYRKLQDSSNFQCLGFRHMLDAFDA